MKTNQERIEKLRADRMLDREDFRALLTGLSPEEEALLYKEARSVREEVYGKEVYLRGLIEFSSYCRNDCYYCGLRRSNPACQRYRLTKEEILDCAKKGYDLGFRTIVLQSGEDPWYTDEKICDIVSAIRKQQPDCAITLSIGEKSRESLINGLT